MSPVETVLLLGEDHTGYGAATCRFVSGRRAACAISAGARPDVPSAAAKFDPNEDAVLVVDAGGSCLLAVADAHYGCEASHRLLARLAETVTPDVANLYELGCAVASLSDTEADPDHPSSTTFAVAVLHRVSGHGFALSFGDSSVALVGGEAGVRVLTTRNHGYVTLARPGTLARERAQSFRFLAPPGALLLAYTDGVDECHYGRPETSIQPHHLEVLFGETGPDAETYARRLADLALHGVDGHPGGEDNIALAVAVT